MPTNFNFTRSKTINDAYRKFFEKRGYLPRFFNAYNCSEIVDVAPTITAACGISTASGCTLVLEGGEEFSFTQQRSTAYENYLRKMKQKREVEGFLI